MITSFKRGMGTAGIIAIVAGIAIVGGLYIFQRNSGELAQNAQPSVTPAPTPVPTTTPSNSEITVKLDQQNKSNETGQATLSERLGKAQVVIVLTNAPTTAQPAHIHMGSCAQLGSVQYNLNPVTNGRSETQLEVPLNEVLSHQPIAINVHKSSQAPTTYVACGDIKVAAEVGSEDRMISPSPSISSGATKSPTPSVQAAGAKVFNITAKDYSFSLTTITVKKGDKVRINVSNTSGLHDWVIDEFNARTKKISNGQTDSIEFVADKAGRFEYYCSVGSHRAMGMKGTLVVE